MSDDEGDKILGVVYFGGMAVFLFLAALLAFAVIGWQEGVVALAIAALAAGYAINRLRD